MTINIPTEGIEELIASLGFDNAQNVLNGRAVSIVMNKITAYMEQYAERREARQGDRIVGSPASANNKQRSSESSTLSARHRKTSRPREEMTLSRVSSVTAGHLTLLHSKLTDEGWIDGNESDFKTLFSGQADGDCVLTWMGKYGNGTLVKLFRQLVDEELVIVPRGFTLSHILEGHFKDKDGKWLTRLDKGDKAHAQSLPVIEDCVKLLKMSVRQLMQKVRNEAVGEDDAFKSAYDPYDHQDLNIHKW